MALAFAPGTVSQRNQFLRPMTDDRIVFSVVEVFEFQEIILKVSEIPKERAVANSVRLDSFSAYITIYLSL